MNSCRIILLTAVIACILGAGTVLAQNATLTPSQVPQGAYVNGPGGAADDNYYFQKLYIELVIASDGAGGITIRNRS